MVGESLEQELEATDYTASAVRKQREINADAQLTFSFLGSWVIPEQSGAYSQGGPFYFN